MARIPYLNEWTVSYGIRDSSGALIQPSAITCSATNANGSAVTLAASPTWDATTSTTIQTLTNTEVGASAYLTEWTLKWAGTASGTDFTDYQTLVICKPSREWAYGSVGAVQDRVIAMTFSTTSTPSTTDIDDELFALSLDLDSRLSAAGHTTPLTTQSDRDLVDYAITLLTSASILERIIIGREPTVAKVETAETWRRQGNRILDSVLDGTVKLTTTPSSGIAAYLPGVSNATAIISDDSCDEFVEDYGAPFDLSDA